MNINTIDNKTPFTEEEKYELISFYVNYYYTQKYHSLREIYEVGDIISECYIKFMRHQLFEKYNSNVTSKKYLVARAVQTTMIDLLRKQRERFVSLDMTIGEDEDSATMMDMLASEEVVDEQVVGEVRRNAILSQLPEDSRSKVVGFSPLHNKEVPISYRVLAELLEAGYKAKDIAMMFINPNNGQPVSVNTVNKYISELREFVLDNIVIA